MNKIHLLAILFLMISLNSCNNSPEKILSHDNEEYPSTGAPAPPQDQISSEPWTEHQLVEPADLAQRIKTSDAKNLPVIISLGAGNIIPGSRDTGASGEQAGLENLKKELESLPKDIEIILYCGCCPFKNCPNVRPAFSLLNEMEFTNHLLLNLHENIKVDWIDKGYAIGN